MKNLVVSNYGNIQLDDWYMNSSGGIGKIGKSIFNLFVKYQKLQDSRTLNLAYHPGFACNLCCPYCYQNGVDREAKNSLDLDIYQDFLSNELKHRGKKYIDVLLIGGEPLLYEANINKFLEATHEIVAIKGVSLITNGTIKVPSSIALASHQNDINVQFTLDGAKAYHDATRHFKNQKGTYNLVLENLERAIFNGYNVIARINLTRENVISVSTLLDDMQVFSKTNLVLSFAKIEDTSYFSKTSEVDKQLIIDVVKKAIKNGFTVLPPSNRSNCKFCSMECGHPKGIILDGTGNLYTCLDSCGQPGLEVGNVVDGYSDCLLQKNWKSCGYQSRYHESIPFSFKEIQSIYYKYGDTNLIRI